MTIQPDAALRRIIAEAALQVAAQKPWRSVTLFDIAAAAGRPVRDLYPATLGDVADYVEAHFDAAMGEGMDKVDLSQSLRDRLFDLMMQRFEAMEPHRAAVLSIEGAGADPIAAAALHHRHARCAQWVMSLAGMEADGVAGKARAQGIAVLLAQARAAWRQDKDGDFARTMATLDKGLRRAEDMFGRFAGFTASSPPGQASPDAERSPPPAGAGAPASPPLGS